MAAANPSTGFYEDSPALIPNPIANMTIIYHSDEENEKEEEQDELPNTGESGRRE